MMKTENFCPSWPLWPPRIMTTKDPQPIQKTYPIIEFSEVSHSKGENILPYLLSLKIDPLIWHLSSDLLINFQTV
jgi:hypothetical protein